MTTRIGTNSFLFDFCLIFTSFIMTRRRCPLELKLWLNMVSCRLWQFLFPLKHVQGGEFSNAAMRILMEA